MVVVTWLYSPGWSGSWQFDDFANLSGLEYVNDAVSAIGYATEGIAGPLKRPVALLSFAPQAEHWPDSPRPFLVVNSVIHAFNGMLVFLIATLLGRFLAPGSPRVAWFGLAVAALWTLSPFLASASLMVVQRMTTLSATFLFAGLAIYLQGRWMMARRPRGGLFLALSGLGLGTILATLSKENGALLPSLALVCELLIMQRCSACPRLPRPWLLLALVLPTVLIAGYLTAKGFIDTGYERRNFDLTERLLSQARILWNYVYHLILPRSAAITPYSDGYTVSRSLFVPPSTALAISALAATIAAATVLAKRMPLFAFAVAWFLAGHLVESTVIPLELYFSHRNYVPAFGLYFLLACPLLLLRGDTAWHRVAVAATLVYAGALASILYATTSLWGQPDRASLVWYRESPESVRAAQALASSYQQAGRPDNADKILSQALEQHTGHQMLTVQRVRYCPEGQSDLLQRLEAADQALRPPNTIGLGTAIQLHHFVLAGGSRGCPELSQPQLLELIQTALDEAVRHRSEKVTEYLHHSMAYVAQSNGDYRAMRIHLAESLRLHRDPQTVILIAFSMVLEGQMAEARQYLKARLKDPPGGIIQRRVWQSELSDYLEDLGD